MGLLQTIGVQFCIFCSDPLPELEIGVANCLLYCLSHCPKCPKLDSLSYPPQGCHLQPPQFVSYLITQVRDLVAFLILPWP